MTALIGSKGIVELGRELPTPQTLPPAAIDPSQSRFIVESDRFVTGDFIRLYTAVSSTATVFNGYYYRNEAGYVSLYTSHAAAINAVASEKIDLTSIDVDEVLIALETTAGQHSVLAAHYNLVLTDPEYAVTSETSLLAYTATYNSYITAGDRFTPFSLQGQLRSWSLNTDASPLDTTSIGEKWGNSIKDTVSGSGSMDFLASFYARPGESDIERMINLVTSVGQASSARARFYLRQSSTKGAYRESDQTTFSRQTLYYSATILLTNTAIDVDSQDLITGSADFVTTGPIKFGVDLS